MVDHVAFSLQVNKLPLKPTRCTVQANFPRRYRPGDPSRSIWISERSRPRYRHRWLRAARQRAVRKFSADKLARIVRIILQGLPVLTAASDLSWHNLLLSSSLGCPLARPLPLSDFILLGLSLSIFPRPSFLFAGSLSQYVGEARETSDGGCGLGEIIGGEKRRGPRRMRGPEYVHADMSRPGESGSLARDVRVIAAVVAIKRRGGPRNAAPSRPDPPPRQMKKSRHPLDN